MASPLDLAAAKEEALKLGPSIRWSDFIKAGSRGFADVSNLFFTSDCVGIVKCYEGQPQDSLDELLSTEGHLLVLLNSAWIMSRGEQTGHEYAMSLLAILSSVTDERVLTYTITLVDELLDCVVFSKLSERVDLFRSRIPPATGGKAPANAGPILRLLNASKDQYVVTKAAKAAAVLLSFDPANPDLAGKLVNWIRQVLRSRDAYDSATATSSGAGTEAEQVSAMIEPKFQVCAAISATMVVVQSATLRALLLENHIIESMIPCFSTRNPQLLYEAVFCFWVLSLDEEACLVMDRVGAVLCLCSIARLDLPAKILRLSLAVLANVANLKAVQETALAAMSETPLPSVVNQILDEKKLDDPELVADATTLKTSLEANLRVLTSMERYEREVESGQLRWSPVHTAEFWKENFKRFEEDNFRLIRHLATVLATGVDILTLAVACYDIGEFARFHPHGRLIIDKLHIKEQVMTLLRREDPELKRHALLCCSKLMVSRWQFVENTAAK